MSHFIKILIALFITLSSGQFSSAADLWTGSCRNVTGATEGNLKLYVNGSTGPVTGFISISGWLIGSGKITGRRSGNTIEFESHDSSLGVPITWKGTLKDGWLTGEYYIPPIPSMGLSRQVGEWAVSLYLGSIQKTEVSEDRFKKLFIFDLERDFNAPIRMSDGSRSSGTKMLFDGVHPMGTPVAITVDSVSVTWADGTSTYTQENLHKYRIELTLYWHGVIRTFGKTRLALTYNNKIGEYTGLEVLSTNGVTKNEVKQVAGAVAALIAQSALEALVADR